MRLLGQQRLLSQLFRTINFVLLVPFFLCADVRPFSPLKKDNRYEEIDRLEADRRLADFRNQRLIGDFCFRFELEHLPRRGATVRYYGTMWGSWNEQGPVTRIALQRHTEAEDELPLELILQNGPNAQAWLREDHSGRFVPIAGAALFEPLLPGVVYAPFDFLMPFLYWSDYRYEGAKRVRSRVARDFILSPGSTSEIPDWLEAVRIGIDDTYNALLTIDVLETAGAKRSSFTVESFKQVQGQWIVKRIVMKDWETKDRTRFKVLSASVGLHLNEAAFSPEAEIDAPIINELMFEKM